MKKHKNLRVKKSLLQGAAVIVFILCMSTVLSLEITRLDVLPAFEEGQTVAFTYELSSETEQEAILNVGARCPKAFVPEETLRLQIQKTLARTYDSRLVVTHRMESQNCTAYVQILSPVQQTFSKNFSIITAPLLLLDVKTCADEACAQPKKVFVRGEKMYVKYDASEEGIEIKTTLSFPDRTTKELRLPSVLNAEHIGTYTLDVTVAKQGFNNFSERMQFAVIEKSAQIREEKAPAGETSLRSSPLLITGVVLVLCIVGLIVWIIAFAIKRKRRFAQEEASLNMRSPVSAGVHEH